MVATKKELKQYSIEPITSSLGEIIVSLKRNNDLKQYKCSRDIYEHLKMIWNPDTIELLESFYVLFFNKANKLIGYHLVSTGSAEGTVVDEKRIMAMCLRLQAQAIAISHNHPSGNLTPSDADMKITNSLRKMCEVFKILLLDHIIVTTNSYYSFADEGII